MDDFIREMAKYGLHPNAVSPTPGRHIRRFRVGNESGKSGWYWLECCGDIYYGAFGNWKTQINVSFCSKAKSQFTETERRTFDGNQKDYANQQKLKQHEAALKARKIWQSSAPCAAHPYADAKGIKLTNLRQYHGALVVPAYKNKEIVSLQFIAAGGDKRFLLDGEMKGCFHHIPAPDWSTIYICEGYATGATIHEATGSSVIVAFNAGNLKAVAELVRENYPHSEITIIADNDRNTEGNPGVTAANKASQAIAGLVIVPQFTDKKSTDFNDLHQSAGIDAVRSQVVKDNTVSVIPGTDWRNYLIPGKYCSDDNGFPHPYEAKSKRNAYLFIRNLFPIFRLNEFSNEIVVTGCPPWEDEAKFMPRFLKEKDPYRMSAHLELFGLRISTGDVHDTIVSLAEENAINPPRDFFDTLTWDKKPRLDTWLTYFMGATTQPAEYLALVGAKWLIGAVSRIYKPGCKFDSVLIFEGSQGIGKSNALRSLATFNGQNYFLDSVGDIRNKDALMAMQGKLIIEMAELASLRKGDNEEIKGFISRQVDEYRPPYGRLTIKRPRYFVLAGTTNETSDGYLIDNTGNRRYWPVHCGAIDGEGIGEQKYQLWAEAIYRFKQGERTWLLEEEIEHATREQESRRMVDAWQERVERAVHTELHITIDHVFEKLGISTKDINRISRSRVRTCMEMLGWYETQVNSRRTWKKRAV